MIIINEEGVLLISLKIYNLGKKKLGKNTLAYSSILSMSNKKRFAT
jgi:hypothetical protein